MKIFAYASLLAMITLTSFNSKDNTGKVKEYLGIPGPLAFNKINYNLSWSAHPTPTYYKQEYLPASEKSESYHNMFMIEAVVAAISLKDVVKNKVAELEQRKRTDPLSNYQVIENVAKGEYILDFIMSQAVAGKTSIVEWNAYRYTTLKDKSGKQGIVLYAYSKRAYGAATTAFLTSLKTGRVNDINVLSTYKIPEVKIIVE